MSTAIVCRYTAFLTHGMRQNVARTKKVSHQNPQKGHHEIKTRLHFRHQSTRKGVTHASDLESSLLKLLLSAMSRKALASLNSIA